MHNRGNWDDLRYVLAVAEEGSVSAAARRLSVNHATVLRRVASFEAQYGSAIFDKSARGYAIIGDRLRVIDALKEVATAVLGVDRAIQGMQAPLRGVVRVTSTDTFCHEVLPPIISRIHENAGELRIDLMSSNTHMDLARLDAEVTVRPTTQLGEELNGQIAAELGFDVYARRGSSDDSWLALSGPIARSRVAAWFNENVPLERVAGAGDSFVTLRALAGAGLGQAILPCILGDGDKRLERRPGIMPSTPVDIWVASHAELAEVPRIRAVRGLLAQSLAAQADALAGRAPSARITG